MSNVVSLVDKTAEWMQDLDDYEAELKKFTDPYQSGKGHFLRMIAWIAEHTEIPKPVRHRACCILWKHDDVRKTLSRQLHQCDECGTNQNYRWQEDAIRKWVVR